MPPEVPIEQRLTAIEEAIAEIRRPEVPIEQRLTAIEEAIAEIRRLLPPPGPTGSWLDKIAGTFKDEPAFDEVVAYGRAFREASPFPEDEQP